jgi:hypothetical protein
MAERPGDPDGHANGKDEIEAIGYYGHGLFPFFSSAEGISVISGNYEISGCGFGGVAWWLSFLADRRRSDPTC